MSMSDLESVSGDDPDVSWNTVTKLDLNDVTDDEFLGPKINLLAIANGKRKLDEQRRGMGLEIIHRCILN